MGEPMMVVLLFAPEEMLVLRRDKNRAQTGCLRCEGAGGLLRRAQSAPALLCALFRPCLTPNSSLRAS